MDQTVEVTTARVYNISSEGLPGAKISRGSEDRNPFQSR